MLRIARAPVTIQPKDSIDDYYSDNYAREDEEQDDSSQGSQRMDALSVKKILQRLPSAVRVLLKIFV